MSAAAVQLRTQVIRFTLVGLTATGLDACAYRLTALALPVPSAKAIGYLVGMSFSIACNRGWSFSGSDTGRGAVIACLLLYLGALTVNVVANTLVLAATGSPPFAFCVATGVSAVCTFLGMRWLIFR